jgi:hypothetical protein
VGRKKTARGAVCPVRLVRFQIIKTWKFHGHDFERIKYVVFKKFQQHGVLIYAFNVSMYHNLFGIKPWAINLW